LLEDSTPYSETWPRSGMTRNGTAYRLPTWAPLTEETECGSWPTPVATDAYGAGSRNTATSRAHPGVSLTDAVRGDGGRGRLWPTPTASQQNINSLSPERRDRANGVCLADAVRGAKLWPTPTTQDAANNGGPSQSERNSLPLNAAVGGSLNPTWVEWLMGFPLGWTALKHWATRSSRKSPKSSAARS
jgi:hypothetical protein